MNLRQLIEELESTREPQHDEAPVVIGFDGSLYRMGEILSVRVYEHRVVIDVQEY